MNFNYRVTKRLRHSSCFVFAPRGMQHCLQYFVVVCCSWKVLILCSINVRSGVVASYSVSRGEGQSEAP